MKIKLGGIYNHGNRRNRNLSSRAYSIPALAGTTQQQGSGWVGQMQGFMQQTFSPGQHQTLMDSTAMQDLHNSTGMQNAMQTGDVKAMQDLMNSDPNVKAQMGQDNLDKMNQFMNNYGGT